VIRKFLILVSTLSLVTGVAAAPSSAFPVSGLSAKVTKPLAPTIISIVSSAPKKGKVDVKVNITLPESNGGSKITGSKVTAGGKSCTLKKLETTCTIRGLKSGKKLTFTAYSKNKKGFSKKSTAVNYQAGSSPYNAMPVASPVIAEASPITAVAPPITAVAPPITAVNLCKLPVADGRGDNSIGGWPRINERLKTIGDVNATVIMVDFPDAPATIAPSEALALISPGQDIFEEMSYGKFNYVLNPQLKWYRMSKNSDSYGSNSWTFNSHKDYISEAASLADSEVDFSSTDSLIIIANPSAVGFVTGPAFTPIHGNGITLDGRYISNGATSATDLNVWKHMWLNHEVTHNLGLTDLYSYENNKPGVYEDIHRFVGGYSYMGFASETAYSPSLLAFERWNLGWLDDSQINCMTGNQQTTFIAPVQTIGGTKAVVIPLSRTKAIVVESRRRLGIDQGLSKVGCLVYVVDSSISSGLGPVQVFPSNLANDPWYLNAPRALGESVTVEGVTIQVIESNENGDMVSISR
jgi:M6 family metalloprotease-like protein